MSDMLIPHAIKFTDLFYLYVIIIAQSDVVFCAAVKFDSNQNAV